MWNRCYIKQTRKKIRPIELRKKENKMSHFDTAVRREVRPIKKNVFFSTFFFFSFF
jgi:hypothetical protein